MDVAANIAKFFPGTGDIVSASIKLGNSIVSGGKFVGSKAFEYGKSIFGHARSKENKKVFRNKYAEHIYDNMAEVSGYLDGEGKSTSIKPIRAASGKRRRVMTTQKICW